jgi:hypothetical protein
MEKMYELREMLCAELDKVAKKGELSAGSLDVVDKLTHSIKSIDTIMAMGGDYSGRSYAKRDSMGRYSRDARLVSELREVMDDTHDDRTKQRMRRLISDMER